VKVEDLHEAARQSQEKLAGYALPLELLLPDLPRINVLPIVERQIRNGAKFNIVPAQIQAGATSFAPGRHRRTRLRRMEARAAPSLQPRK